MPDVQRSSHSVYNLQYHFVFVPKYRKTVLDGDVAEFVEDQLHSIADDYRFEIIAVDIVPDHVHLFLRADPTCLPSHIVQSIEQGQVAPGNFVMDHDRNAFTGRHPVDLEPLVKGGGRHGEPWPDHYSVGIRLIDRNGDYIMPDWANA